MPIEPVDHDNSTAELTSAKPTTAGLSQNVISRFGDPLFEDGRGTLADRTRPSARLVSNVVSDQPGNIDFNLKDTSRLLIFFGQFLDHDITMTPEQAEDNEPEEIDVEIPVDDPEFRRNDLTFIRSEFVRVDNQVRNFISSNTAWLDLGTVYGDTDELNTRLRLGTSGLLSVVLIDNREFPIQDEDGRFICGDVRCEENPMLFSFHTLFLREHNRLARAYRSFIQNTENRTPGDEETYQNARLLNIIQYQSIVWDNYLPLLIGRRTFLNLVGEYEGFVEGVDPTMSVAFTTAVYRYGHSGVSNEIDFLSTSGNQVRRVLGLAEAFANVDPVLEDRDRLSSILIGQSLIPHDILDTFVVDGLRNSLFGNAPNDPTASSGLDLVTRNIMRCRDHGCQSINYYREIFGLEPFTCAEDDQLSCFRRLTGELDISQRLFDLYEDFEECDLWVCGMAEMHLSDSLLGGTFSVILTDQFNRMRNGDRLWFELVLQQETFSEEFLEQANVIFPAGLEDVLLNNLQEDLVGSPADIGNLFAIEELYVAWLEPDTFQVEWLANGDLRNNVDSYTVNIRFANGTTTTNEVEGETLYFVQRNLQPSSTYVVTVTAERDDNGRNVPLGEITVRTMDSRPPEILALNNNAEATADDGVEVGLLIGIIAGVIGGVALLGSAAILVRRKRELMSVSNDLNSNFF